MKLISKYTWISLSVSLIVLILGGCVYYLVISRLSDQQLDRDLREEYAEMLNFIDQHKRFPKPYEFDSYEAKFVSSSQHMVPTRFIDTTIFEAREKKAITERAILATVKFNGADYLMTILASKESSESLIQLVSLITLVLITLIFLILFVLNRFLFSRIWTPFYELLQRLKNFSFSSNSIQGNENSFKVQEFRELQAALNIMAAKAEIEYQSMKAFTENASHEMMTPVALINSKLDNLIQDKSLREDQLQQLEDIYSASRRLSQLNNSLLLLVKIDNGLIKDQGELDLRLQIETKTKQFEEVLNSKNLKLTLKLLPKRITASAYLVDILLNNLIGNAIRHNNQGGEIIIALDEKQMIIENTGTNECLDSYKVFERFQKNPLSEGTGLGLTIARNVCLNFGFNLNYRFMQPFHQFYVVF